MTAPRKPVAFKIGGQAHQENSAASKDPGHKRKSRPARAAKIDKSIALTIDDSLEGELATLEQTPTPAARPRRFRFGAIFLGATGFLLSLAFGLWIEELIAGFFARSLWLGWASATLAGVAVLALAAIVAREAATIARLRSVLEKLRTQAADVARRGDIAGARQLLHDLDVFTRSNASTARGREAIAALEGEVIDATDLVGIAERELFAHLDRQAKDLILQSAKRVSVVTAVSPRALIDVGYVLYESGRLIVGFRCCMAEGPAASAFSNWSGMLQHIWP